MKRIFYGAVHVRQRLLTFLSIGCKSFASKNVTVNMRLSAGGSGSLPLLRIILFSILPCSSFHLRWTGVCLCMNVSSVEGSAQGSNELSIPPSRPSNPSSRLISSQPWRSVLYSLQTNNNQRIDPLMPTRPSPVTQVTMKRWSAVRLVWLCCSRGSVGSVGE